MRWATSCVVLVADEAKVDSISFHQKLQTAGESEGINTRLTYSAVRKEGSQCVLWNPGTPGDQLQSIP